MKILFTVIKSCLFTFKDTCLGVIVTNERYLVVLLVQIEFIIKG